MKHTPGAPIADARQVTDQHGAPEVVVAAARFAQRHAHAGIGAEPIGEQAARRAGSDERDVELANSTP